MLQFVQNIVLLISICILKFKHGTSERHSLESISNANSFPKCSQNKYCGKLLIYMQILLPISWIIISMLMIALRKCNILDLIFQQCYIAFFMILRCLLRINNSRLCRKSNKITFCSKCYACII